jgi:hypothetical protein
MNAIGFAAAMPILYSGAGGAGTTGGGAERFRPPVEVVLSDSSVVEGIGVTGVLDGSGASLTGSGASEVPSLLDPVFVGAPPLPTELPRWIGADPPPEVPEPPLGAVHPGEVGSAAGGGVVGVEPDGSTPDSAEAEPDSPPAASAPAGARAATTNAAAVTQSSNPRRRFSFFIPRARSLYQNRLFLLRVDRQIF